MILRQGRVVRCPTAVSWRLHTGQRTAWDVTIPSQEFTCPHCGIDFTVPEDELIFQSVPKKWLLARVQAA
jgi:hypothetical protein